MYKLLIKKNIDFDFFHTQKNVRNNIIIYNNRVYHKRSDIVGTGQSQNVN